MKYTYITQRDIQLMGDCMILRCIAPKCNELIEVCCHTVPEFCDFVPKMDFNFNADVLDQLIMEAIKMDYDNEMDRHAQSLRQHILQDGQYDDYESAKDIYHSVLKYVQFYRDLRAEQLQTKYGSFPQELLGDDMSQIENRLAGHRITSAQYEEMKNINNTPFFDKITKKQIVDVNKVKNDVFRDLYRQYESLISNYKKEMVSDESIIKSTMAFFTLEWKYSIEWIYKIASDITNGILPESSLYQALRFADTIDVAGFHGENRFFMARNRYYEMICHPDSYDMITETRKYQFMHYLMEFLKVNLKEYLLNIMKTTPTSEKAAFIKERYWIWDDFQEKEWDNKTIRNARKAFDLLFSDCERPNLR